MDERRTAQQLDRRHVRAIAVLADGTDEGSVRRYLDGSPVRTGTRVRVERALATLGLEHLIRPRADGEGA